jgi:site-specific recombinase XerD
LSGLRLADIKAIHAQAYFNELIERGCGLAALTLTHKILTVFFNYCLKADLIVKSPLLAIELPTAKRRSDTNKPVSDADIAKFRQAADDNPEYFIFVFAIFESEFCLAHAKFLAGCG